MTTTKEYNARYYAENKERIKENRNKHYAENKERLKETIQKYRAEHKEQIKEYNSNYREEHKDYCKEYLKVYAEKNRDKLIEYNTFYSSDIRLHAITSIKTCTIGDIKKWDLWCKQIKRSAKKEKHTYSDDFTNDIMFDMMAKGCFYCGQLARTIDRIDSTLGHIPNNCVGSCYPCNVSKGADDLFTFIRKAYYRARGEYIDDDTDIWFVYNTKPRMSNYKTSAKKQKVPFELTEKDWNMLIEGVCKYCKRSPTTWFGIDREIPSKGYVIDNVVSCCWDCNRDKHVQDADVVLKRNEMIAERVDRGELVIKNCSRM